MSDGTTVEDAIKSRITLTKIVWENVTNLSNMNDFTTAGVYELSGEHTRNNDNLPIENRGGGHTFSARLLVLDSSIGGTGIDTDKCITQILSLSNRVGGDGNVYIRTARGATLDSLSWEKWATLQTNVNVGQVSSLDSFIDNGIYSGVYSYGSSFAETFVMVVINDYAVAGENRSVAQFKYAFDTMKYITTFKYRELRSGSTIDWTDWEDIGEKYVLPTATSDVLGGVKVYQEKGKVSSGPSGVEYSVNIRPNGQLYSTVNHADANNEGVIKVSNVVGEYLDANPLGNRYGVNVGNDGVASVTIPYAEENTEGLVTKVHSLDTDNTDAVPTAKAVKDALDNIPQGGGSVDLSDYYTKEEIDDKPFVKSKDAFGDIELPALPTTVPVISELDANALNPVQSQAIAKALEDAVARGRELAKRDLYIAAGALYNDTDEVIKRTAFWGEEVDHLPKHYYLNGLGDITEEQMLEIYEGGRWWIPRKGYLLNGSKGRTNIIAPINSAYTFGYHDFSNSFYDMKNAEVLTLGLYDSSLIKVNAGIYVFSGTNKLKRVYGRIELSNLNLTIFGGKLEYITFVLSNSSITFSFQSINKESILYAINNASATKAITITLHADVYNRLANDADVVSALDAKNIALASGGGSINLVSA